MDKKLSIVWLPECKCTLLTCMDGETLLILCPKHGPAKIRDNLISEEYSRDNIRQAV